MGLDADLGVEIEAVEAGFAPGGQVQWTVALGDVVRGVGLGVLARRGGGEGVGEGELVLVVGRRVVAGVEQGRLEGEAPIERRPLDLAALVERVVDRLRPLARAREVALEVSVPDGPLVFEGDELLLERAVSNLVHNAVRHRRGPGHVAVLVDDRLDGAVRVTVKSDGAPVDDATLAALSTGSPPPSPARTRGRGLGLRIVRHVAALHGLRLTFHRTDDGALEAALESCAERTV